MNRIIILFSIVFAVILTACVSKEEKLKSQYIEACADGDFEMARTIVTKLEAVDSWSAREGLQYVNDKEIYTLLAKPSRDNDQRIMYLYNAYESSQLPDMTDVIEVAISMGNENLPEKLVKAGVAPSSKLTKVAANAEMTSLFELLVKKNPEIILEPEVRKYYKEEINAEGVKTLLAELYRNSGESIREKVVKIAQTENMSEASEWIKESMEEKLKEILSTKFPSRPALGMVKSDHYGDLPAEYSLYSDAVSDYNGKIREFIAEAVACGQIILANKALSNMKPTLQSKVIGDWCRVVEHEYDHSSVYNALQVSENHNDITEARKIIQGGK